MVKRYYADEGGGLYGDAHGDLMYYEDHASLEALCCGLFDVWIKHTEDIPNDLSDAIERVTTMAAGE